MSGEPTTPTGKRLLGLLTSIQLCGERLNGPDIVLITDDILAIEAEARQQERERLRALVRDNPGAYSTAVDEWCVPRSSLERILAEPSDD
jgi:hypothetical protein